MGLRAVGVVAGVLVEAVERGDGVGGGDVVVGTDVDDVAPETIHIVRLNHNYIERMILTSPNIKFVLKLKLSVSFKLEELELF